MFLLILNIRDFINRNWTLICEMIAIIANI